MRHKAHSKVLSTVRGVKLPCERHVIVVRLEEVRTIFFLPVRELHYTSTNPYAQYVSLMVELILHPIRCYLCNRKEKTSPISSACILYMTLWPAQSWSPSIQQMYLHLFRSLLWFIPPQQCYYINSLSVISQNTLGFL